MTIVNSRTSTFSGAYLTKRAKDLARKVVRFNLRGKNEIIDGYLIQAKKHPLGATGYVTDPPGQLVSMNSQLDPRGDIYNIGQRDFFDSRTQMTNGPFNYDDLPPFFYTHSFYALGFDPNNTNPTAPWNRAQQWRPPMAYQKDILRGSELRLDVTGLDPYPYDTLDQVAEGAIVFSGVRAYPRSTVQSGYFLSQGALAALAPGYRFMCETSLGYMSFEYQGMPLTAAGTGGWTLLTIPVVKDVDPNQAVSWGSSALLFVLVNGNQAVIDERPDPVYWSRLWELSEHSVDFFHPGPWEAQPRASIRSPFSQPQDNWDDFWTAWNGGGRPIPAGGSRPNWTDAISAAWFNGRFVVNVRLCALNATLSDFGVGFDYDYVDAGGSAHMRFEVTTAGDFTAEEVQYEVWDSADPTNPGRRRPYDVWVAGHLDEATVYCVNPVATFPIPNGLVEVRWRMQASRAGQYAGGEGPYMLADMDTGRLEFTITRLDEEGNELAPVVHEVNFDSLGAGVLGPTAPKAPIVGLVLLPPTGSYKLWPIDASFVAISKTEVAFAVHEAWQDLTVTDPTPVKLAVLNIETGAVTIRGTVGFDDTPTAQQECPVHLCCLQRAAYDDNDQLVVDGVLFASVATNNAVRISRDAGATWQDYLTFPRPLSGAYYIGNPLMIGKRPGAAIL